MTPTLLLATDLSHECHAAFSRAIRLAADSGARLDILHVTDPWLPEAAVTPVRSAIEAEIERTIDHLCATHGVARPELQIQLIAGDAYAEIVREAYERGTQLAILGTHRKHGQADLVNGTTLSRVLRRAPCPVLSITHTADFRWHDVLVPIDFSLASRYILKEVLTRLPGVRLTLLHAWDMPVSRELSADSGYRRWREQERARLRQQLERELERLMSELDTEPDIELVVEQGDPTEVLLNRLVQQPPDLLALGSHGRLGIGQRAPSSLMERLLSEARCDLMLCRTW